MKKRRNIDINISDDKETKFTDIPSDIFVYNIFRFSQINEVYFVFTLVNKYLRDCACHSLKRRKERGFNIIYFPDNPELNISENDMTKMIDIETFDLESCELKIFSYMIECQYVTATASLLRRLSNDSIKWDDTTTIISILDSFEENDSTIDKEFDIDEEREVIEEEDGEHEDEIILDDSCPLSYEVFFDNIDLSDFFNNSIELCFREYDIKSIENAILSACLKHNTTDLFFKISEKYELFNGNNCFHIIKSLSFNNDEISLFLVKKGEIGFEEFLGYNGGICDLALHSSCKKTTDYLFNKEFFCDITDHVDGSDSREMTNLYFNAFFMGKRYNEEKKNPSASLSEEENDERSTLSRMVDNSLEDDDVGGSKYSKIMDSFFLKCCSEFSFGSEEEFEDQVSYLYKFPISGRKRREYESSDSEEEEDQEEKGRNKHEENKNYQNEEFFNREKKGKRKGYYNFLKSKDLLKMMRKAGVMAVDQFVWDETRYVLRKFLREMISISKSFSESRNNGETEISGDDVKNAREVFMRTKINSFAAERMNKKLMDEKEGINDLSYLKGSV